MIKLSSHLMAQTLAATILVLLFSVRVVADDGIPKSAEQISYEAHMELMSKPDLNMHGDEKIAMIIYPGFTALDLTGPQYIFASMMGAELFLITTEDTLAPIKSDTGLVFTPTHTLADAPQNADIVFVPGGTVGTSNAMGNEKLLAYLSSQYEKGAYVTSVCTGAMILGKAGVLKGKRATSHWITKPLLTKFGATPVDERVVIDGKIITGGGVTAGIDFGLVLLAHLRGDLYAKAIQLQSEYSPAPPFESGSPEEADPWLTETLRGMSAVSIEAFEKAAE